MNGVSAAGDSAEDAERVPDDPVPPLSPPDWDAADDVAASDEVGAFCHSVVSADSGHSPAGKWSAHAHPYFKWSRSSCSGWSFERYTVNPTWRSTFDTRGTAYHSTAPEGSQRVAVNTLWSQQHCHGSIWGWCYSWHTHYRWGGWSYSPTVYLDLSRPDISMTAGAPKVVDSGTTFLTSDSPFKLSAYDRWSGLKDVQHRFDGASWTSGTSFKATGLEDGSHTLGYRAIDNVNWITERSFSFVLDNTAPELTMLHPTFNSFNMNRLSAESCTENPRVTLGDETVAEVERPDPEVPETPEAPDLPPTPPMPPMPPAPDTPPLPGAEDVATAQPDACAGEVGGTQPVIVPGQSFPVPDDAELPPEAPTGTEDAEVMEAQDVSFTPAVVLTGTVPIVVDVQDATVGTENVQFIVNGEVYDDQTGPNGEYVFDWDTTKERAGEHTLTVRAFDRLGNVEDVTMTVIVLTQTEEGAAKTTAHALASGEQAAADAQADAEAAVADAEAGAEAGAEDAEAAVADAQSEATAEACAAAGVWAQFIPQCVPGEE